MPTYRNRNVIFKSYLQMKITYSQSSIFNTNSSFYFGMRQSICKLCPLFKATEIKRMLTLFFVVFKCPLGSLHLLNGSIRSEMTVIQCFTLLLTYLIISEYVLAKSCQGQHLCQIQSHDKTLPFKHMFCTSLSCPKKLCNIWIITDW